MSSLRGSWLLVIAGFGAGVAISFAGFALSSTTSAVATPSDRAYYVSIDEITQNFVFAEEFSGTFSRSVTMSDGSVRKITLRSVTKDGAELVELSDKSRDRDGLTYMGRNGTTTNGTLMINVKDAAQMDADFDALVSARK